MKTGPGAVPVVKSLNDKKELGYIKRKDYVILTFKT